MLLTIIGLVILFIILVNVVLFCLETEAVGIIISIIGILGFLSGGHLYGVIVVIVGICLYDHAKETNEKDHYQLAGQRKCRRFCRRCITGSLSWDKQP